LSWSRLPLLNLLNKLLKFLIKRQTMDADQAITLREGSGLVLWQKKDVVYG
jgi:hypothetical protein